MSRSPDPPDDIEIQVWRIELGDGGREAARAALGRILAECLGVGEPPELVRDGDGKPRLADGAERLAFNLSHSGRLALVAAAGGHLEVGVDVELRKPRRDLVRLASRWLPAEEAAAVATAPEAERERVFYAAWTRHEARVKCAGTGLAGPPPGAEVRAWPLEVEEGYAAAVAAAPLPPGAEPRIVLRGASGRP